MSQLTTLTTLASLRTELRQLRQQGQTIALVPTMGNLHAGHLRLVEEAKRHADKVIATIFVNPLQFGPDEDFASYPRTLAADQAQLASAGCDLLFTPSAEEVYPHGQQHLTRVSVPQVSEGLCSAKRPGHFDGVATVVTKLFNMIQPDVACFGQKDYQQLAVIRKLTEDLNFPINIIGVPTCRSAEGLALSSRNAYLTEKELERAPKLYATLQSTALKLQEGKLNYHELTHQARAKLAELGFSPEYIEIRALDLSPALATTQEWVILAAARIGKARLIDNLIVKKHQA